MPPVQSWSDVFAILAIAGMLIGGLAWGLKLEFKLDAIQKEVNRILRHLKINGEL